MAWFLEGSFPIGLTGIELELSLIPLLEPSLTKTAPSLKKRRQLKLPKWIWRFLFKALSRVLVNVLDLKVTLVDIGVSFHLQQVAVLFKSDMEVPCRAALKAKDFRCSFSGVNQSNINTFEFLQLTDIAATVSVVIQDQKKRSLPSLNSVKIALGDMEVTIVEDLIKGGMDIIKMLPKQKISSSETKPKKFIKTENLDKMLTRGFPQMLGFSLHKLMILGPEIESSLLLKNLHLGMESTQNDHLEITGGILKSEMKLGINDAKQGVLVELPTLKLSAQIGHDKENIKFIGIGEIQAFQISIDDALVWILLQKLSNYTMAYSSLPKSGSEEIDKKELTEFSENSTLLQGSKSESWNSDESDPVYRNVLDSSDLGLLQSAEEQEYVQEGEETNPLSDEPSKDRRVHPLIDCASIDWELSLKIEDNLKLQLIADQEEERSIIMELLVTRIMLGAKLNKEGRTKSHCSCGFAFKSLCIRSDEVVLGECVRIQESNAKCEGTLELARNSDDDIPSATLGINCDTMIHDLAIKTSHVKLQRLLTLVGQMSDQLKSNFKLSLNRHPKRRSKSKSLAMQLKQWKAEVLGLKLEHEMEIIPVQEYCSKSDIPPVMILLKISSITAQSGSEINDCNLHLTDLKTIIDYQQQNQDQITLLTVYELSCQIKKQLAMTSVQLIGSKIKFDAEIDFAVVILQLIEDSKTLLSQSKDLQSSSSSDSTSHGQVVAGSSLDRLQQGPLSGVPVRVPSNIHSKMRNFVLDIKASDLIGKIKISDSDLIELKITEATVVTRKQNPRFCLKHLIVQMNNSRILECIHVKLRVIGPCYLTELIQAQISDPSNKRRIGVEDREVSFKQFIASPETQKTKEDPQDSTTEESQIKRWRMKGFRSMGIQDCVLEDYSGEGSVLDFFSIDIEVETVCFVVPHDQNLGRLILFTELWIEAVKDVIQGKLPTNRRQSKSQKLKLKEGPADLIEVCLSVKRVVFRLDPHPLEAWLAIHKGPLQEAAVLRHAWEETLKSLHEDLEDTTRTQSGFWINKSVFQDYWNACGAIEEAKKDLLFHHGALMSIAAHNVDAMILVGDKKSPNIIKATTQRIKELDHPISDEITFARVQPIYLVATATDVSAHFDGLDKVCDFQ